VTRAPAATSASILPAATTPPPMTTTLRSAQIEKCWKHHAHTDAGTFRRDPTTRSKSASDRPICVGGGTRSRTTSAGLVAIAL
jgi:hypothetical protein